MQTNLRLRTGVACTVLAFILSVAVFSSVAVFTVGTSAAQEPGPAAAAPEPAPTSAQKLAPTSAQEPAAPADQGT